jgi:hypothetical protein
VSPRCSVPPHHLNIPPILLVTHCRTYTGCQCICRRKPQSGNGVVCCLRDSFQVCGHLHDVMIVNLHVHGKEGFLGRSHIAARTLDANAFVDANRNLAMVSHNPNGHTLGIIDALASSVRAAMCDQENWRNVEMMSQIAASATDSDIPPILLVTHCRTYTGCQCICRRKPQSGNGFPQPSPCSCGMLPSRQLPGVRASARCHDSESSCSWQGRRTLDANAFVDANRNLAMVSHNPNGHTLGIIGFGQP